MSARPVSKCFFFLLQVEVTGSFLSRRGHGTPIHQGESNDGVKDFIVRIVVRGMHLVVDSEGPVFVAQETSDQASSCGRHAPFGVLVATAGGGEVGRLGGTFSRLLREIILGKGYELTALLGDEVERREVVVGSDSGGKGRR